MLGANAQKKGGKVPLFPSERLAKKITKKLNPKIIETIVPIAEEKLKLLLSVNGIINRTSMKIIKGFAIFAHFST